MPWVALTVGLATLLIPLGGLLLAGRHGWRSRRDAGLALAGSLGLALAAFLAGPWAFLSYYLRYLLPIAAAWAVGRQFALVHVTRRPTAALRTFALAMGAAIGLALGATAVRGLVPPSQAVDLALPLRGARFLVIQGGNSPLLNPFHWPARSGRWAVDLVQLNRSGNRARRILPHALQDYEIFGAAVYSPCTGRVATAVGNGADNPPGRPDVEFPPGNHVLLECAGVWVLLAHLREGSVAARPGDRVASGDLIGAVGNSGNTTEPHLHVQATRAATPEDALAGDPVALRFGGRFVAANALVGATAAEQPRPS